jgi:DNA repair protein RecO (recombination protein O)
MPAEESSPAIVLRTRDYAEADRIVTLLTREFGKLSGIAKGAKASRRRFERKLEPFSHVTLYFRRRPNGQLVFITRAEATDDATPALEDDLAKIALGSYMLELADALTTEEAEAAGAYRVLVAALAALGREGANAAMRRAYELKLLAATGYGLDFANCRRCGAGPADYVYFVITRGGIVCAHCRADAPESAVRLNVASASALARLATADFGDAGAIGHGGADAALALARFLGSILDRRLRSVDFMESVL